MKKYLLLSIGFCLSIISFDLSAQNTVVVTAFNDVDANGIDDDGFIIPNITTGDLYLTNSLGTVYNHTEVTGVYTFTGLPDDDYVLHYIETPWTTANNDVLNPAYVITGLNVGGPATDNDVDPISGSSVSFNLTGSVTEMDVDLGLTLVSAIGDFVWEDINGDGLSDGEPGLDGVTVTLLDGLGAPALDADMNVVPAQVTAGGGFYWFGNLPQGDYIVQFSLPTNGGLNWYATTFSGVDPDFSNDSDADPDNAFQSPIYTILPSIVFNDNIDAGFWVPANVGNMVFCDENGNGVDDDGVGGVDNIDVRLIDLSTGLTADDADGNPLNTTTAGGGMYMFTLVPPRPNGYRVEFSFNGTVTDPPYQFTFQDQGGDDDLDSDVDRLPGVTFGQTGAFIVVSNDLEEETRWDAGVFKGVTISGIVWLDNDDSNTYDSGTEGGPGGVLVELFQSPSGSKVGEINTNAGDYEFLNVPPGEYFIQINSAAFISGGPLNGTVACPGSNDPGDMVDNDDNAPDTEPGDVITAPFTVLSNCAGNNSIIVDYIDFCFKFDCNEPNDLAYDHCDDIPDIDILCDVTTLATFCAIMPTGDVGGTQPMPLCPGTASVANNISWFAFVAYGGSYSVTVTPVGCTEGGNGNFGVQLGLYTDCTFTDAVYCQGGCSTDPITFESSDLEEGQTYYFFIDGCAGSVCSYEVSIAGTPIPPNLMPDDVCIQDGGGTICDDTQSYCPDADVTFEATGLNLTVDFTWTITETTGIGGGFTGDANPTTTEETLVLNFENEGTYQICVNQVDNGCSGQQWNGNICRTVIIAGIEDEMFDMQTVCPEDLNAFDPSVLAPSDPNGDGVIGWQGPTVGLVEGTNMFMVTDADGCMYEQEFELAAHPVSDKGLFESVLCTNDLPIMIDAIQVSDISFAGQLTFVLQDVLLVNSMDVNGCDSIIDISLEKLDIFNGELTNGPCLPEGIPLNFGYATDPTLSTDGSFFTYIWTDPDGNPLPDNYNTSDPQDNIAPTGMNGTYTLTIDVNKDGTSCQFMYDIDIDFSTLLPADPTITGPPLEICESDSIQTYTAIDFGDAYVFNWNTPSGVTVTAGGMTNDESVTVNWAGSIGGTISLTTENACGTSEEIDVDVTLVPQLVPAFDFSTEVCEDSIAVVSFTGDQTDIDSYMWDFDGGSINNGADANSAGPFDIIWTDGSTDKTITLTVTHNGGCTSIETVNTVSLVQPLMAPIVNCNPQTGEVSFSWADVAGATGYAVDVTSGQSGTLDDANNTFTVTGLIDGETVTIELIVMTGDACVMVTSAAVACTSQDCVAPSIDLMSSEVSFCLDENTGTTAIVPTINSGETGTGIFSGTGITDPANGTFDPDSAMIGTNIITYNFTSDDDCIGQQTIAIDVFAVPTASFTSNVDTICITDVFELTYDGTASPNEINWTTDDGQTFNGTTPTVSFTSAGEKTISLVVVKDGCTSEMVEQTVFVEPELNAINVTCLQQELDMVEFGWNAVTGATGYEVTVTLQDGSTVGPFVTNDLSHSENGLNPGDVISISVVVLSDSKCPAPTPGAQNCEAVACPSFSFTYDNAVTNICVDGSTPLIDLQAEATGGDNSGTYTWSGSGNIVNDTQFDPNGLPEGSYTLFVEYLENGCGDSGSVEVNITHSPVASFDVTPDAICIGSTIPITYTGSQLTNQTIDWSGSDIAVSNVSGSDYEATFDAVGTFNIVLDVENGDCTTSPAMASITVEPELVFDMIECDEQLDNITFSWTAVDCASEYEVFIGGVSQGVQTETTFIQGGLVDGDEVEIEVIAVSGCACGNVMQTRMCESRPCVQVALSLSAMGDVTEFCNEAGLSPVEIITQEENATADGVGSWSGTGVNANGMFDPLTAGVGTHEIVYTFVEPEGCEEFTETITFTVFDTPTVEYNFAPIDCYDMTNTMLEIIPSGGDGNYTITLNNEAATTMNDVEAGSYDILVVDDNLCTAETSVNITIPNEPMPTITGADSLIIGETSNYAIEQSIFTGLAIDSIVWTANGDVICNDAACFSLSNQAPDVNTTYVATVYYNNGCSVTTTFDVEVREPDPISIVEIPNIISPNDDGENDTWKIFSNDENVFVKSVSVYDRWGNRVFGAENFNPALVDMTWNGKYNDTDLQPGVYVYFVDFVQEGRDRIRSGDITIIR